MQHPRLPFKNAPRGLFLYVRACNQRLLCVFFHAYISRKKLKGRAYANKISSLMNARRRKNNGARQKKPWNGSDAAHLFIFAPEPRSVLFYFFITRACDVDAYTAQEQLRQTWIIIRRRREPVFKLGPLFHFGSSLSPAPRLMPVSLHLLLVMWACEWSLLCCLCLPDCWTPQNCAVLPT